jgi:16S rRNA (adenine1518-N6/adenine1519-N6)-dimethyltransferase
MNQLCDVGYVRRLLKQHGLWTKKSLGQNFLIDDKVLAQIVQSAKINQDNYVIEIGPGLGTLTSGLLEAGAKVLAVEKDPDMVNVLEQTMGNQQGLKVTKADILRLSDSDLEISEKTKYKVVANLPYYITSPILQYFLEKDVKPEILVLMVQKEVAKRIVAGPGDLSVLAISVQIYGKPEIVCEVNRSAFFPEPQVDSSVIKITPYQTNIFFDIKDRKLFFQIVKAGFGERRKQLHNSLSGGLAIPESAVKKILDAANVNPTWRAENLSVLDWKRIYDYVSREKRL